MYLVAIAWIYVALMMAVAEAFGQQGTVLGAIFTFIFYGVLPVSVLMYIMGSPMRRRARRQREQLEDAERAAAASGQPDAGGHAPAATEPGLIAPVRKEP